MATVGRGAAIVDFGHVRFKGWFAWILWWMVHIYFLIGFRNRVAVFLNWAWAYATYSLSARLIRSEEHTSELQSLMRISYAVLCLKKKKTHQITQQHIQL